jgi:VWFA-related protein
MTVPGILPGTVAKCVCAFLLALFSGLLTTSAQTAVPAAPAASEPAITSSTRSIRLDVVAETKSGQPVNNLEEKDFAVLDNKAARAITSFKIVSSADDPVNVILLIDAVNTPFQTVAYARGGIEKFLKSNEGQLANPTTLAVLTDQGVKAETSFSKDGNALGDDLDRQQIGLREITRNSEWSGMERLQICLKALHQLITFAGALPGRKIVIWISPGWPLVSGPRIYLDSHEEEQIFNDVVDLSTQLRETNLTIYNTNPVGVMESMQQADYYESFLKGVSKLNQVQLGDLSIQVLAAQSGGLVIEGNSDVAGMIQRCLLDAKSWYEIGFDPLPADKPDDYHHIDIKIDKPGVVARTRDGYYANPEAIPTR